MTESIARRSFEDRVKRVERVNENENEECVERK